jgi:hypothetical protein
MPLRDEDFVGYGVGDVAFAASAWTAAMHDVTFHYCIEGVWEPSIDEGIVNEIASVRDAMARVDEGLRECRRRLAEMERPARMRAARRERRR